MAHRVTLIPGDGTGPERVHSARAGVDAAERVEQAIAGGDRRGEERHLRHEAPA